MSQLQSEFLLKEELRVEAQSGGVCLDVKISFLGWELQGLRLKAVKKAFKEGNNRKTENNYPYNHEKANTQQKKQLHGNALVQNIFSDFAEIAPFNRWKNMYTSKLKLQKRVYGSHQNSAFLFRYKSARNGELLKGKPRQSAKATKSIEIVKKKTEEMILN